MRYVMALDGAWHGVSCCTTRCEMMNSRSPVADASERVLDRGEKIELLVTRTEQLQDQSYRFSTESRRLKWSMCRDNYKLWAILVIVVIVRRFSLSRPLRCSGFFSSFP